MRRKKFYPWSLEARINDEVPADVRELLSTKGWNALGVYEAVKKAIAVDKRDTQPEARK